MPIYDQGYRRYEARGPLRTIRFWPITREALRLILSRRWFLVLLMVSWVPFLARCIQIFVVTRWPEAGRVLPVDGRLFGQFLGQQLVFNLIVTIFGGAGLVANDLRTGAILVYLSRPLTRRDYVLGKLGVLMFLNLAVTLAPGLLLYALGAGLAPEQFLTWDLAWVPPAIVLYSVLVSLVMSLVALAVSSLSRSARVAGIGFFGLLLGLDLVRNILRVLYRRPETALLSLQGNLEAIGRALFDVPSRAALPLHWMYPTLVLGAVAAGALLILRSRVRAVEIVR